MSLECISYERQKTMTNNEKLIYFYKTPIQFIPFCAFGWKINCECRKKIVDFYSRVIEMDGRDSWFKCIQWKEASESLYALRTKQRTYHISNSITHYNYFTIAGCHIQAIHLAAEWHVHCTIDRECENGTHTHTNAKKTNQRSYFYLFIAPTNRPISLLLWLFCILLGETHIQNSGFLELWSQTVFQPLLALSLVPFVFPKLSFCIIIIH